jgi:uncharacterized membrane protein
MVKFATLRNILVGVTVSCFFFLPITVMATEQITGYETSITVNQDSTLSVTEKITYDFGTSSRHGIFRDIPVEYDTDAGDRTIGVELMSVSRDGNTEPHTTSRQGNDKRIKIGDPNKTITGAHTYTVSYSVRGALNFFEDQRAELYWDVVGTGWEVPVQNASTTVSLPKTDAVTANDLTIRCFAGPVGTSSSCAYLSTTTSPLGLSARASSIQSGQAKTIVLNFPDQLVEKPTTMSRVQWFLSANPLVLSPLVVLIIGFILWLIYGKDPQGRGTIMAQYEPPEDLKPIMAGALLHEKAQMRDITAGIVYLAEQGYISIEKIEDDSWFSSADFKLKREKDLSGIGDETYRSLATALFADRDLSISEMISMATGSADPASMDLNVSVKLSELKQSSGFAKTIRSLSKDIKKRMKKRGWFVERSQLFNGIQALIILGSFAGVIYLAATGSPSVFGVIGLFVAFGIEIAFLSVMKRKTKEGAVLQENIEGFKHFLSMTQKERLEFHNAPDRNPQEFMEYLPYAIAFGVEQEWAEQFGDLDMREPDWYHGAAAGGFAANDFASDMSGMSDSFSTAAGGGSGASGAGGAGGGAGGGGGGSW